ncbi:MAG TPA: DinB family protein, partial [Arenibacter sp.]|nr:DinB family protein [Arenibacter sp.]
QDDLRNRYQQLPFGTVDAYQILLFMSGHTERHIKQMEEVMDDEDFPMD